MPATKDQIDRVNELSTLARTAWLWLLGYLVFVGITLLGVKDADFFVPSRQTELPLVGVSIPTASFFYVAPVLGAALYTYLHLFLIKLWDAHAEARTTDADATHHWLVNDFVLIRQHDPVARARPLAFLTDWITRLLVWAAGPIVLGYAWWRSMPAHAEWMTLLIGACFWITLVVGFTSWWRAERVLGRMQARHWSLGVGVPAAGLAGLLVGCVSWLRTEGGLEAYADGFWTLDNVSFTVPADAPVVRWFTNEDLLFPLARADLVGEELVALPRDWRQPAVARRAFREVWCRREGIAMDVCDQPAGPDRRMSEAVSAARRAWCRKSGGGCADSFAELDRRFADAWASERRAQILGLTPTDLSYRDLRGAASFALGVPGARLRYAALDATTLWRINGEGADLRDTSLRDAILWEANLVSARLQRADLSGSHLADARLDDANLRDATLQSVVLLGAVLRGADLTGARLSGIAHGADLRGAKGLTQAQLDRMIGDDRTLLPTGRDPASGRLLDLPNCWAEPPIGFERLIDRLTNAGSIDEGKAIAVERPDGSRVAVSASDLRDLFLCPETDPVRTGTRCPPELPRERCLAIAAGSEDAGWN